MTAPKFGVQFIKRRIPKSHFDSKALFLLNADIVNFLISKNCKPISVTALNT